MARINRYIVSWQTKPSLPGLEIHQGTQEIYGWDKSEAIENALKEVNRKLFRYESISRLEATKVQQIGN